MKDSQGKIIWKPTEEMQRASYLAQFISYVNNKHNIRGIPNSYNAKTFKFEPEGANQKIYETLLKWSNRNPRKFWEACWSYLDIDSSTFYDTPLVRATMPGARWFEGAKLNYAEHIFKNKTRRNPALLFKQEGRPVRSTSWNKMESRTASFANFYRKCGLKPGDRVAAVMPNSDDTVVAALGAISIGAVWSCCSPDFGAESIIERFSQIEPKVIIVADGYRYNGNSYDRRDVMAEVIRSVKSIRTVVYYSYRDTKGLFKQIPSCIMWDSIIDTPAPYIEYAQVPFDHPLWILYSSGTTGTPKAITHSHGGNLIEHLKYLRLHNDVHPGERFFWYSTTGWMMWNFTIGSLLAGATAVLFDGSPAYPDINTLWQYAEQAKINHFGTSAPFLTACQKAGISPGKDYDLSRIRSIGSTGSPLPPEAYEYVKNEIGEHIWLSSMAGGTDVCTAWVGGNPLLPVYEGEIQCRCLGCSMESWDENGEPLPPNEVGEMVVTKPMPSMPIKFWNDPGKKRYRNSYFKHFPGVWRHGDWVKITDRGTVIILGRSDATLNRQGVRIGTAEIYRALDQIEAIKDSLIVSIEYEDGSDWMPLFVIPADGHGLTPELVKEIKTTLRTTYSPRHVPDEVIVVDDIPYTISGKKMETPVKRILLGHDLEKAYSPDAMRNPDSMKYFIELAESRVKNS